MIERRIRRNLGLFKNTLKTLCLCSSANSTLEFGSLLSRGTLLKYTGIKNHTLDFLDKIMTPKK